MILYQKHMLRFWNMHKIYNRRIKKEVLLLKVLIQKIIYILKICTIGMKMKQQDFERKNIMKK